MTEFCKCGHHLTQHNISPEMQINLFGMRPSGIFAGMNPYKIIKHELCIGYGKYLFTEKDYPRPGDVTKYYDPCPCAGFELFQKSDSYLGNNTK